MSKKVLSLALVVVMLMSMFVFSTSALDLSSGQIGFKVVSDAEVGAPAGTVVTVKVYYVLPEGEEDTLLTNHNISLGYDNTAFSVETNAATAEPATFAWGTTYADYFKCQKSTCNAASTISNNIIKNFNDADTAQGWNAGVQIQELYEGSTYTTKTGFNIDPDCEIFSLQFVALTEIGAEDTIGIVTGAVGTSFFSPKKFTESTTAGDRYDAANVILTEAVATPVAASKEVYHVKNQIQWADKAAGTVNLGVVAGFDLEDINIAFNEAGTSTNVASVGATVVIGDKNDTKTERFVYSANNGASYYFRVVIAGVAKDYTGTITVTPFVTMNDAESTTYYADAVTIDAAELATMVGRLPA